MLHLEFRLGSGAEVLEFRASLGLAFQDSFGAEASGAEVGASSPILLRQAWKLREIRVNGFSMGRSLGFPGMEVSC